MGRREQLLKIMESADRDKVDLITDVIDNVVFLEEELKKLRQLPHIKVHPTNPELQKVTQAGKLYRFNLQQYNNAIKILISILGREEGESDGLEILKEFREKMKSM